MRAVQKTKTIFAPATQNRASSEEKTMRRVLPGKETGKIANVLQGIRAALVLVTNTSTLFQAMTFRTSMGRYGSGRINIGINLVLVLIHLIL